MNTPQFTKLAECDQEDSSRVSTPTASTQLPLPRVQPEYPPLSTLIDHHHELQSPADDSDAFAASLAAILDSSLNLSADPEPSRPPKSPTLPESNNTQLLLPLPALPTNKSQTSVSHPDSTPEECLLRLEDLPPEIASADISVAPDGSFVETSSGAAAREIKRRYDQYLGVGKDVQSRSPFAITAFVNQHGRQMYRVGPRELSAPAASAAEDIDGISTRAKSISVAPTTPHALQPPFTAQTKRRSRMSVHSFLPPTMFNKPAPSVAPPKDFVQDGSRSPPTRKLRKTRSIPNMNLTESVNINVPAPQPTPPTGRPHAHSVSSADAYRISIPPPVPPLPSLPTHDIFSDVLSWNSVPPSPFSSHSASHRPFASTTTTPPDFIVHPFGAGVTFDIPAWSSPSHLTSPPALREMQSFESGLTARADPQPRPSQFGKLRARLSDLSDGGQQSPTMEGYASASPVEPATPVGGTPPTLAEEPSMLSKYSTALFDVLQNYRGLPTGDKLDRLPANETIKLSLKSEETAAPRDDPRFVIWGEIESDDHDDLSHSRGSVTDLSSGHSIVSRRKSGKRHTVAVTEAPSVRISSGEGPKRVLVAATIERWIAQLTSELNYDELLIFFLTYRTYVSAEDLGHLLICRFHWALGQPTSGHDEMVRRIVRVRTFIALRYWLLTFFSVDFVPNRELRLLFANWLNSLLKDPVLERHKDALGIVRKLRKLVLDCKDAHTRRGGRNSTRQSAEKSNNYTYSTLGDLSNGHFAESLRRAISKDDNDDVDIDLDFDGFESATAASVVSSGFGINTTSSSTSSSKLTTSVDLAMLRQPLHLAFLHYGKQAQASPPPASTTGSVPLPVAHSTISRVIVNTMGRLGRWKRVLNSRAPGRTPMGNCIDVSAFDVEANETGDLLLVRGGVEQYLRMVESHMSQPDLSLPVRYTPQLPSTPTPANAQLAVTNSNPQPPDLPTLDDVSSVGPTPALSAQENDVIEEVVASHFQPLVVPGIADVPDLSRASTSLGSTSQSDFLTSRTSVDSRVPRSRWQPDVVSIDDLDLSDMSSDESVEIVHRSPGLKKLARRLPNRRDFQFVRHSIDSVSSMGIRTHRSVLSAGSSSVMSGKSASAGPELGAAIHQWQVNALVDSLTDEEEDGDVEAALRRLEGQINKDKQRVKQSKVDGWVQSIRERLAAGQFGAERTSRYSSDEEDYGVIRSEEDRPLTKSSVSRVSTRITRSSRSSVSSVVSPQSTAPPATLGISTAPTSHAPSPPAIHAVPAAVEAKIADDNEAVPPEILNSRMSAVRISTAPTHPSVAVSRPLTNSGLGTSSWFVADKLHRHQSFIKGCRSADLVQHFSMIDRELFLNLRFEELISQDWTASAEDANILDWGKFLQERARLKAEGRGGLKTSALTVVRGRFNLMANFVVSEIVLTHPSERAALMGKFVRMAWKAYNMQSFNTLVAIIAGLRSQWVTKAMGQHHVKGLGMWETRVLNDLSVWTTSEGDFKHIRRTVDALAEAKPATAGSTDASSADGHSTTRSRAASEGKPPPPAMCIPFFGVYLSCLHQYSSLPDLIDPTTPNEPVAINPLTNSFESPAHPEVFSALAPLPPSVQLEPLINVHKQRLTAAVVKSVVAGQHLAARVQYPVQKRLFQQCLKLRGLDSDTLSRALALYQHEM